MKTDSTRYESFWEHAARPFQSALSKPPHKAALVIIGAGYTGLSTALEMADHAADVVVLEAGRVGDGASGRNGGQVIPGLKLGPDELRERLGERRAEPLIEAVGGAADHVFERVRSLGIDCDARQVGWLNVAHAPAMLEALHGKADTWRAEGVPVQVLDAAATAEAIGNGYYCGGWLDPRAGMLQPFDYVQGLARAARARGVVICEQARATRLRREPGGWRVWTAAGEILAGQVVLATNAYSADLIPGLGQTHVPLWSLQAATAPLPAELLARVLPGDVPVSDSYRVLRYFRRSADGRLLLGTRGAFTDRVGPADARRVAREMLDLYPDLAGVALDYCWSGRIAVPAGGVPLLQRPEPGLVLALGYYGRGVAMATLMGRFVAALLRGCPDSQSVYPVTPFRPMPLASLHRGAARVAVGALRLRDLMERRASRRASA